MRFSTSCIKSFWRLRMMSNPINSSIEDNILLTKRRFFFFVKSIDSCESKHESANGDPWLFL